MFLSYHFNPTVSLNFSVTVKNSPDRWTESDSLDYRRSPPDYYYPQCKFFHWPNFTSDFPPNPPIHQSVRQWEAGFIQIVLNVWMMRVWVKVDNSSEGIAVDIEASLLELSRQSLYPPTSFFAYSVLIYWYILWIVFIKETWCTYW